MLKTELSGYELIEVNPEELELHQGQETDDYNYIELDNGVWLKGCGDGRYYNDDIKDYDERWGTVSVNEYDENGNFIQSVEFLGYVKL